MPSACAKALGYRGLNRFYKIYPKDCFPCNPDLRQAWWQRVMLSDMSISVRLIPCATKIRQTQSKWYSLRRMGELAIGLVYGWLLGLFTKLKQCDFAGNRKVVFLWIGLQVMYFAVFYTGFNDRADLPWAPQCAQAEWCAASTNGWWAPLAQCDTFPSTFQPFSAAEELFCL